jgi:hypothetical protein
LLQLLLLWCNLGADHVENNSSNSPSVLACVSFAVIIGTTNTKHYGGEKVFKVTGCSKVCGQQQHEHYVVV